MMLRTQLRRRAAAALAAPASCGSQLRAFSAVPETMRAGVVHETGAAEKLTVEEAWPVPTLADGQVRRGGSARRAPQAELTAPAPNAPARARASTAAATPFGSDTRLCCLRRSLLFLPLLSLALVLQVLVKNEFAGINFIDTYHRGGLYPRDLPFIGGQEGGGTVVATTAGAEAAGIAVGDRVAYSVLGTYCEYTAVPAAKILTVPVRSSILLSPARVRQHEHQHQRQHEQPQLQPPSILPPALPRRGARSRFHAPIRHIITLTHTHTHYYTHARTLLVACS
jgi:hypothetical protein